MAIENLPLRLLVWKRGLYVSDPYRVCLGFELGRLRMHLYGREWRYVRRDVGRILARIWKREWAMWQCEGGRAPRARRGWTARQAERRMLVEELRYATQEADLPETETR